MLTEDLLATCWTTAGEASPLPGMQQSRLDLPVRIQAAARAGFRGFGLVLADLVVAERQYGLPGIKSMLRDNGMIHVELELLTDWWTTGSARQESDEVRRRLLRAAEALGASHIKVAPDVIDLPWDRKHWAREFARLGADAQAAGVRVGLEFLPWANIKTVHEGLALVEDAGHDACGLLIDIWHTERAHTPPSELAAIPLERIVGVEISDAAQSPVGSLFEDTVHRRRYCGDGSFQLKQFILALRAAGWTGPWGVEILSDHHRRLPLQEAVSTAFRTAAEALDLSLPTGVHDAG